MNSEFGKIIKKYVSPTLFMYTSWIVSEAEKRGIRHLYFLARDGYQMYCIAKRFCGEKGIKCSYFFCSRYALRMAAYRFFDDSAYERLFIPSFRLTAKNMLERADFDRSERELVYTDTDFVTSEDHVMGRTEFSAFCEHVKNSIQFNDILKRKSDAAYADMIEYIKQEGLHKCQKIGIVDLGWTGSLQYTLRRLLDSMNVNAELYGFYMGMLDRPPKAENSEYLTWLFSEKDIVTKSWFAHNLMECVCSAPHGMTTGYSVKDNKVVPVFSENENNSVYAEYIKHLSLRYAEKKSIVYKSAYRDIALKLLRRLMFSPTVTEAKALSVYRFCDDVGEQYHRSIVQAGDKKLFRNALLFRKIINRDSADGFYWYYGSVAASGLLIKPFYRYEYFITRLLILKAASINHF